MLLRLAFGGLGVFGWRVGRMGQAHLIECGRQVIPDPFTVALVLLAAVAIWANLRPQNGGRK